MSIDAQAIQNQTDSDIDAERIEDKWRRSGETAPKRPSSQELARRLIEGSLEVAGHIPGVDDRAQAALGRISTRLAMAAESNNWVRDWLKNEIQVIERHLHNAAEYREEHERKSA